MRSYRGRRVVMCGWHVGERLVLSKQELHIVMQNFLILHGDPFLHIECGRQGTLWKKPWLLVERRVTDLPQQNKI